MFQSAKSGAAPGPKHYSALAATAPYGAAVLRFGLGLMWIAHGLLKLMVFGVAGTAAFFEAQGFPGWAAGPVAVAEVLGGLAIIAGFYGRYVSLALLPVLAGALLVHLPNGWVFSNANGGWEYPIFLMLASCVHALTGDGALALGRTKAGAS